MCGSLAVLCYSLITGEETYTNKECLSCFNVLLGTNATPMEREYMSLANNTCMTKNLSSLYCMEQFFETLPYFIESGQSISSLFQYTGKLTPQTNLKAVENKYLQATREMKVIAQTDEEIAMWPELVDKWLQRQFSRHTTELAPIMEECT